MVVGSLLGRGGDARLAANGRAPEAATPDAPARVGAYTGHIAAGARGHFIGSVHHASADARRALDSLRAPAAPAPRAAGPGARRAGAWPQSGAGETAAPPPRLTCSARCGTVLCAAQDLWSQYLHASTNAKCKHEAYSVSEDLDARVIAAREGLVPCTQVRTATGRHAASVYPRQGHAQ